LIVSTFKSLAELADFEADAPEPAAAETDEPGTPRSGPAFRSVAATAEGTAPAVNINIQLQLPATEDGAIYEKLFAALKKHLFS
jgi:hypothetical protein